jgi:DNA-directed RNA polymerase subunit alpha
LLSSLQGAAIVSAKIHGIQHEFTTIPGVIEDVTDIILNLKQVRFAASSNEPQKLQLVANEKGEVTAAAIQENQNVSVLNPDLHIATLSEDIDLVIDLEIRTGKGYVTADMHEGLEEEIGIITLDASFSPIRKVAYRVEQARVGQMTNYDKLILEVWTDGSVRPDDAIAYSAKILKEQLSVFINFDEGTADVEQQKSTTRNEVNPNLFKSIEDLELPVRASNCLKSAGIHLVGELVQKTENDMLKTKNFGRKSLEDIRRVLTSLDLDFGMKIDNFDEQYQDWVKRKEEDEA